MSAYILSFKYNLFLGKVQSQAGLEVGTRGVGRNFAG
jgi:hypothetical protein